MELKITINTSDPQLVEQILNLIKSENATFLIENTELKSNSQLLRVMESIAKKSIIKSIKDPIAWQKETRKEKRLIGRG